MLFEQASRSVGEQLAPVIAARAELERGWHLPLDTGKARARLASGQSASDPATLVAEAGPLDAAYLRATKAIERAGLASNAEASRAREMRARLGVLLGSWLAGDAPPREPEATAPRLAAAIVASSVLRRAAAEFRASLPLERWIRAVCPCCGSHPEFAFQRGGRRVLMCSRCDTEWRTLSPGCVGCGGKSAPQIGRIYLRAIDYRLMICHGCGRYLKERPEALSDDPLVERTLTALLDEAAEKRGLRL